MRIVLVFSLIILLNACASAPTTLILSPTVLLNANATVAATTINLQVVDHRTQQHVLQIHDGDNPPQLISNNRLITTMINQSFQQSFVNQGYQLSLSAPLSVTVVIKEMLINLNQHRFKYEASNHIILQIKLKNAEGELTKTFNSKGASNGILTADFAVLERIFNQQLGELINQAAHDPAIRQFLTK